MWLTLHSATYYIGTASSWAIYRLIFKPRKAYSGAIKQTPSIFSFRFPSLLCLCYLSYLNPNLMTTNPMLSKAYASVIWPNVCMKMATPLPVKGQGRPLPLLCHQSANHLATHLQWAHLQHLSCHKALTLLTQAITVARMVLPHKWSTLMIVSMRILKRMTSRCQREGEWSWIKTTMQSWASHLAMSLTSLTYQLLAWLWKEWDAPIYVFFKPLPTIGYINNHKAHIFQCATIQCCAWTWFVCCFLDKGNAKSTSNLWCHAKACWGEEVVATADGICDISMARMAIQNCKSIDGSIIAAFWQLGRGTVTYSHQ